MTERLPHDVLFKTPITTILNAHKKPTVKGIHACPGPAGGVEWNGPAFDPDSHMLYVGAVDWCSRFRLSPVPEKYVRGRLFLGAMIALDPPEKATGWLTALDANTGIIRWQFHTPKPIVAGVTPTAGGLVFTGDLGGNFYALDKASGKVLQTIATGGCSRGRGGLLHGRRQAVRRRDLRKRVAKRFFSDGDGQARSSS
jgi:glucose dehydrogenase